MSAILKFLFPVKPYPASVSWYLLIARIFFGLLLMSHGVQKIENFHALSSTFPDPLGVGSHASLVLAIFGEVICSAGFIVGAFYRLALIPMIFTMCVAVFVIHAADPFSVKELPVMYLFVFVMMYIAGPGQYALDSLVASRLRIARS